MKMKMRRNKERWRFNVDGTLRVIVASSRTVALELAKKWYPTAKEIVDAPDLERTDETIGRPVYKGETNIVIAPPSPPNLPIPGLKDWMEDEDDEDYDYPENVSESNDNGEKEIKRGRGRPRKNHTNSSNEPKRKRGRPRIHPLPDPNAPKRKRGRPRKNPL